MSTKIPRPQLRQAAVNRRVDSLFKAMSTDFLLREQFVTEPSQVLSEYVHARKLDPEQAEAGDQLIYSVMANQQLLGWLRDYSQQQGGAVPPRSKFMSDFSRAVIAHGGHHVVLALAKSAADKQDVLTVFESFLPILFATFSGGRMAQTMMTTGHTTGTMVSTAHDLAGGRMAQTMMTTGHTTGTMVSTAHDLAGGRMAQTMMTTGHTTGTMVSTAHDVAGLRAQTEMSTGHTTGTDMSTGHFVAHPENVFKNVAGRMAQTMMSTGHTTGTDMTTGHFVAQPGNIFKNVAGRMAQTMMSTGHTTGTDMTTGHLVGDLSGLAMSTEKSTGTMISTGHTTGTDMTTGHIVGSEVFQVGFERVTLAALVDHAIELRDMGALDMF